MAGCNLYRGSEQLPGDPLGTVTVQRVASRILADVADKDLHPSVAFKAARAAMERKISPGELGRLVDIVKSKRARGELASPGAYFVTGLKRLFAQNGITWWTPAPPRETDYERLVNER